ncbi:hypothetical protein NQ317_013881 [Molorchus minor]|uniref:PDZ domain-containing protein n=1 Tax=Molorchus minor TaxID=1323400 RepID=A0ABQ9K7J3_9CUCU|nr:hypothetical protein NQ317_013881 [Molorchus minor]
MSVQVADANLPWKGSTENVGVDSRTSLMEFTKQSCIEEYANHYASYKNTNLLNKQYTKQNYLQSSMGLNTNLQPVFTQPRMAQLETLEAKVSTNIFSAEDTVDMIKLLKKPMASIEVSLSSSPRRKKNGNINGINIASSIRSIPKEIAAKELENLRNALRDRENIIHNLKGQLTVPSLRINSLRNSTSNNDTTVNGRELTDTEKKQAEDRLNRLKIDVDNKRLAIKNLKMALERLDITDNIDIRIQQAELEYQLGREELNLLTLLEETRALQFCLEESNKINCTAHTLYSCVEGNECVILCAIEVNYDLKSPRFGAGQRDSTPGLWVDWALEETGLYKEDRLIEVNGKIVLDKTREDLLRLLAAAPDPAQIVILRKVSQNGAVIPLNSPSKEVLALRSELEVIRERAEEAQKAKAGLKSDNIRLTHRISYLEEQVSELLTRTSSEDTRTIGPSPVISTVKSSQNITNINISTQNSHVNGSVNSEKKSCQKTAQPNILHNSDSSQSLLPIRSKSSLSNISNIHISPSHNNDHHCHKDSQFRHKHRSSRNGLQYPSNQSLDHSDKIAYRKHNHHHKESDYSSETNSTQAIKYNKKKGDSNRYSSDFVKANSEKEYSNDVMDQSFKKATKIVHELTRNRDTLYEKHRQKCITASEKYNADILKHYNARKSTSVLDFRSEIHIGPKYTDSKSVEDLDIANSGGSTDRAYKNYQDARSVKSLDFDSDCNSVNTIGKSSNLSKTIDYTSEPTSDNRKLTSYNNYYDNNVRPRPTPPKKPLRLSLHKTHSLQSVDTNSDSLCKGERKSLKRTYKGGSTRK